MTWKKTLKANIVTYKIILVTNLQKIYYCAFYITISIKRKNESVSLHQVQLVLGWMTIFWQPQNVTKLTRSTQLCILPGFLNQVPALSVWVAEVKVGLSLLLVVGNTVRSHMAREFPQQRGMLRTAIPGYFTSIYFYNCKLE